MSASRSLAVQLLLDLLKAYSPPGHEKEAVEVLRGYAERLGFDEVYVDEVGNLVARYGDGARVLALVGHVDTVGGELPVAMEGSIIKGRGAVDAKGPLAAMMVGAALAKPHLNLKEWAIYAIALVGEEGDSRGAKWLLRRGFKADGMIIAEPSNTYGIILGYRGSAKVEVTCKSKGGHSSSPPLEDTACDKLFRIWMMVSRTFNEFQAHGNSVAILYLECGEAGGYTVHPKQGRMLLDLRVSVDSRVDEALKSLESCVLEVDGCALSVLDKVEPAKGSSNNPVVRALVRSVLLSGGKPKLIYKLGTSDMNLLYGIASGNIAAYGPGRSELAHSDAELIEVDELMYGLEVYRRAIIEYCGVLRG